MRFTYFSKFIYLFCLAFSFHESSQAAPVDVHVMCKARLITISGVIEPILKVPPYKAGEIPIVVTNSDTVTADTDTTPASAAFAKPPYVTVPVEWNFIHLPEPDPMKLTYPFNFRHILRGHLLVAPFQSNIPSLGYLPTDQPEEHFGIAAFPRPHFLRSTLTLIEKGNLGEEIRGHTVATSDDIRDPLTILQRVGGDNDKREKMLPYILTTIPDLDMYNQILKTLKLPGAPTVSDPSDVMEVLTDPRALDWFVKHTNKDNRVRPLYAEVHARTLPDTTPANPVSGPSQNAKTK